MKILRNGEGQTLIFTALAMAMLLGFMALALDVGLLFRAKRKAQIAADAAATAGALDYFYTASETKAKAMAQTAAQANHIGNDPDYSVAVNCAPQHGPRTAASCNGYFEAFVRSSNQTIFMGMFGRGIVDVVARAVAGPVTNMPCIFLMNDSGTDLSLQGSATIENPDGGKTCAIYVNSNSSNSIDVTGKGNSIDSIYVSTMGGITGSGVLMDSDNNQIPTAKGAPQIQLPAALTPPVPKPSDYTICGPPTGYTSSYDNKAKVTVYSASPTSLPPGCYGIGSAKNTILNIDLANINLSAGKYVFDLGSGGTLNIGNNVTGSGLLLDVYTGNVGVNPTNNANLSASSTPDDPYNGILLLEPESNTGTINIQFGAARGKWDGIIDAPGANLTLHDQGGFAFVTGLVVGDLQLKTGTIKIDNYSDLHPTTTPLKSIALVE